MEKEGLLDEWGMESPYELSISAKAIRLGLKCVSNDEIFVFHKWSGKGDPAEFRTSQKNFLFQHLRVIFTTYLNIRIIIYFL